MEVSVLYKFLWIPALTVLAFFAKHYFHALEKKNEALSKKQDEIEKNIINLEMELNKNYYDKREIKEHIVLPLMDRFSEVDNQVKVISGMMVDIHSDMAILKYKILGEDFKNK